MFRFDYHLPGTPPATLLHRDDRPDTPPEIKFFSYDKSTFEEKTLSSLDELDTLFQPGRMHWINVQGLGDLDVLRDLAKRFNLHPLAIEDAVSVGQRPKLERFGDVIFILSGMLYFESDSEIVSEQLSIFMGRDFVITLQEERGEDFFERIRDRIRSGHGNIRSMKSDYLTYAILDAVVDSVFPILEVLGDGLEDLETALLDKPTRQTLRKLYEVKRLLLMVRRDIWPHREIFTALMREEEGLVQPGTLVFLRDCYDHITQLIDMIESCRDIASGLMDVYLSSVGVRTNEIMRVLTFVSTFFIPLTFLAGVYGMNFDTDSPYNMPELKLRYGYLFFWGACVVIAILMFLFFKKKRWI